eukprot:SAG22_NODE_9113_length_609_cov_1.490196_1_plen_140_part_10
MYIYVAKRGKRRSSQQCSSCDVIADERADITHSCAGNPLAAVAARAMSELGAAPHSASTLSAAARAVAASDGFAAAMAALGGPAPASPSTAAAPRRTGSQQVVDAGPLGQNAAAAASTAAPEPGQNSKGRVVAAGRSTAG